mmetsp:Transcript_12062/g.28590  ORF Transcript_12062/g.28590 Transcript_12062/m.28590 type:complete len:90 (-) Transcript_12062:109-378(-)
MTVFFCFDAEGMLSKIFEYYRKILPWCDESKCEDGTSRAPIIRYPCEDLSLPAKMNFVATKKYILANGKISPREGYCSPKPIHRQRNKA